MQVGQSEVLSSSQVGQHKQCCSRDILEDFPGKKTINYCIHDIKSLSLSKIKISGMDGVMEQSCTAF